MSQQKTPSKGFVGTSGPVTIIARPTFFVDVQMNGWPTHELAGVTAECVRGLALSLQKVHEVLAADPKLGLTNPVRRSSGEVKVLAWRDTDKPRKSPNFFLDIQMPGRPNHEMLGVSIPRIKALAEALLKVSVQLQ